jgi:hypothetical protein
MSRVETSLITLVVAFASASCQTASGTLITPISVTSSVLDCDTGDWGASHLIDNSGLSAEDRISATHDNHIDTNSWASYQPGGKNDTDYFSSGGQSPVLVFGLDKEYSLDDIVIWNYAADNVYTAKNSAKSIEVDFSRSGVGGPFDDGHVPITLKIGYAGDSAQIISLGHEFFADAVRLTIIDNYYDGIDKLQGGGDRVALSEVKFLAPEPPSLLSIWSGLFAVVIFLFLVRGHRKHCLWGRSPICPTLKSESDAVNMGSLA